MAWETAIGNVAGSIIGGLFGKSASDSNAANARAINEQNIAMQREFAQNGVRWKVADAKAAGVHPLFAMGAQTHSFTPVGAFAEDRTDYMGIGQSMGQDLGRAIAATRTKPERVDHFANLINSLNAEKLAAEIELVRSQTARNISQTGPGMPTNVARGSPDPFLSGQGDSPVAKVVDVPLERTGPGEKIYAEPGAITDVGWLRTPTGFSPVPSKDAKERIEDVAPHEWAHFLRNNLLPESVGGSRNTPPDSLLPSGTRWSWHPGKMEWQIVPNTPTMAERLRDNPYMPWNSIPWVAKDIQKRWSSRSAPRRSMNSADTKYLNYR